jgi:hypothetical protein
MDRNMYGRKIKYLTDEQIFLPYIFLPIKIPSEKSTLSLPVAGKQDKLDRVGVLVNAPIKIGLYFNFRFFRVKGLLAKPALPYIIFSFSGHYLPPSAPFEALLLRSTIYNPLITMHIPRPG